MNPAITGTKASFLKLHFRQAGLAVIGGVYLHIVTFFQPQDLHDLAQGDAAVAGDLRDLMCLRNTFAQDIRWHHRLIW